MTFTTADLLLSDEQANEFTKALASAAQPDPISACLAEAVAKVESATSAYEIPEEWLHRLARALALFELYARLPAGRIPENVQKACDQALQDLADIRSGQYAGLLRQGGQPHNAPNPPHTTERALLFGRSQQEGL